jgi:hypothetical protein
MVHVHAPLFPLRVRTSFVGAALLLLLPGCPTDPVPAEDTGSSTSAGSSTTGTPQPDPDSTTSDEPPCGTGGCPPNDTTESTSGSSSEGSTGSTGGSSSEGSSSGVGSSSSGEPGSSSTTDALSAGTSSSSSGEFETGVIFLIEPDVPLALECDPFAQDCPVGEKCNAWSNNGSSWNATACFPLDPAPVGVGETCLVQGSGTSGIDNCELGAMCWDVDVATNEGTCVGMCTGSAMAPICPASTSCAMSNDGALNLCLPGCDPLVQNCVAGQACYPVGPGFTCAPDASGGLGFDDDPCEFINVCDPGLMCIDAGSVENCFGSGCCTPFCDISVGVDPCPSALEECVAWFAAGMAPPGLDDVGVCAIP